MLQATLQKERDGLIAEKERLTKAGTENGTPATTDSTAWEKERAELVKARDETADKLKVNHLSYKSSATFCS